MFIVIDAVDFVSHLLLFWDLEITWTDNGPPGSIFWRFLCRTAQARPSCRQIFSPRPSFISPILKPYSQVICNVLNPAIPVKVYSCASRAPIFCPPLSVLRQCLKSVSFVSVLSFYLQILPKAINIQPIPNSPIIIPYPKPHTFIYARSPFD